jgi:drug/metabolite transporter (DMT)-like permease
MNKLADIAGAVIVLAGIFVMVRPGSQGPGFVSAIGNSFSGVIGSATGGGQWNKP